MILRCAPCAIITDKVFEDKECIKGCTIIQVVNIETAYWKFVEYYRSLFQIPVIAVTGTSGKTTCWISLQLCSSNGQQEIGL